VRPCGPVIAFAAAVHDDESGIHARVDRIQIGLL
jgi:hypothetical protein